MSSSESYLSAIAAFSCGFATTTALNPVIRGGGGLAPKEPGSSTERSPLCENRQLFCACHSQKGGCFAPRSTLDVREIDWRATKERPTDRKPRDNRAVDMWG